jgi:hypothetical protein
MKMEAAFNRRMRKTARTVVWEGAGAQSPAPDPIGMTDAEGLTWTLSLAVELGQRLINRLDLSTSEVIFSGPETTITAL